MGDGVGDGLAPVHVRPASAELAYTLVAPGSLWLAVLAIRGRRAGFVWAAVLGALFILGAGFNGASFLNYNQDANSYVMALLFAAAVLCYIIILALPGRTEPQAPAA